MQKFSYTPTNPFSGSLSSLAIGAGMVIVPLVYPFGIRIGRMPILGATATTIIFVVGGLALLTFTVREIMQARKLIAQGGEITVDGDFPALSDELACLPPTMSSAAHSSKAPMRSTPSSPPSNNRIYTTNKQRFAIHDTSAKQNILSINVITEKTMRHIFKLLAASVAAATICSCSSLTGYPTDAEASYAKAIEIAKKSVDTDKFKVYSLSFMEGETLSDNLFLISVKLVNKDNQAFSQSYYMTGLDPTALSDVQRTFEAPEYETTVGIDLTKLDAAQIAAQIAQAKTMLPEGHTFKSVGSYQIEEDVPAGNSVFNRNKTFGKQHTSFVVRFTEDGKETESSAGKTSYIYYEAEVTVEPDGTLSIEEN